MKKLILLLIFIGCICPLRATEKDILAGLQRLDEAITESARYDKEKDEHIATLRTRLENAKKFEERFGIISELVDQFKAYQCDSALQYVNLNIAEATRNGDEKKRISAILTKCDIMSRAGLFSETFKHLRSVDRAKMDAALLHQYYAVMYCQFQFMFENTLGTEFEDEYRQRAALYCDSALMQAQDFPFDNARLTATGFINNKEYDKAINLLDRASKLYHEGQREYSILRSTQAHALYQQDENDDDVIVLLTQAAISDLRGSIKENMAIRFLAELLYKRGMVEYANKYVKKSMEDASFFSARMRSTQVGQMLPLIDKQHDLQQKEAQHNMQITIYILIFVAIIFAIGMFLIIRLTHRLSRANRQLQSSNDQVVQLNNELKATAEITKELNVKLSEANKIKEAYMRQFIEMSSRSINNLEHFRKSMLLLLTMNKREELQKSLKSNASVNEALKELYVTFDKAFLTIFPTFVEKFNALLRPEERIEIRRDEPFSTEMRIYALLRMGITDPKRMADFLRCSLSTIYTYRSKMKARAIDPETFEDQIMAITAIE